MRADFDYHENRNIVKTTKGLIRGYYCDGVYRFSGIPYARAKRFQEAEETQQWKDVREAVDYGWVSPLLHPQDMTGQLLTPHSMWTQNEHCQFLNVRTPSLEPAAKLPVMVWLHGGGYFEGSSIEQTAYEGSSLAGEEQVVVVSLNHRLNILGFLDASVLGEVYENSGNAGMTDIVEALRWIQENIAAFGGDPGNVTLFGQSGGGGKIITLMQIPAAANLFHKAIIQSGVLPVNETPVRELREGNVKLIDKMSRCLKLSSPLELMEVPYRQLAFAYLEAKAKLRREGIACGGNAPLENGYYLGDPAIRGFTEFAASIPVICGTTMAEINLTPDLLDKDMKSKDEVERLLKQKFTQEGVKKMLPLFRKIYPDKKEADLLVMDHMIRKETLRFLNQLSSVSNCSIYSYLFTFEFPYNGGKAAWHCSEIPFVFRNTRLIPVCHVPGAKELEIAMSRCWGDFARGSQEAFGRDWKPYDEKNRFTWRFDSVCGPLAAPDEPLQELLKQYHPSFMPDFMD